MRKMICIVGVISIFTITMVGFHHFYVKRTGHNLNDKQFLESIKRIKPKASQEEVLNWILKTNKEQLHEGREVIYTYTKPERFPSGDYFYDTYFHLSGIAPDKIDGYYFVRIKEARKTLFKSWDVVVLFYIDKNKKLIKYNIHEESWGL